MLGIWLAKRDGLKNLADFFYIFFPFFEPELFMTNIVMNNLQVESEPPLRSGVSSSLKKRGFGSATLVVKNIPVKRSLEKPRPVLWSRPESDPVKKLRLRAAAVWLRGTKGEK